MSRDTNTKVAISIVHGKACIDPEIKKSKVRATILGLGCMRGVCMSKRLRKRCWACVEHSVVERQRRIAAEAGARVSAGRQAIAHQD